MSFARVISAALEHATDAPLPTDEWPAIAASIRALNLHLQHCENREELLETLVEKTVTGPAPQQAINNLERYFESLADETAGVAGWLRTSHDAVDTIVAVFGHSQFLSETLIRHPELAMWLSGSETLRRHKTPAQYMRAVEDVLATHEERTERKDALCRLKRRELLRIGTRDVLRLATVEEVTRETSDLAQAIIHGAMSVACTEILARFGKPIQEQPGLETPEDFRRENLQAPEAGMCVIGMGKLGGRELNFSSDIDLIFIYDAEGYTTGRLPDGKKVAQQTNHVFFTRMGENMVAFLSEHGPEGNLYRVDMRLRPEGKYGPLARSLESFIQYLDEQARDWERLAFLKARILCGPATLSERLYRFTQAFVFAETPPDRIVREVERLKVMIDREVTQSDRYRREVKRGYGGIREIEFIIAAMQIIYGRQHQALRVRNIFLAIERLREVRLLAGAETDFYFEAYEFLRLVEHRLQMAEEHQTHTIPTDPRRLTVLAAQCGFPDSDTFMQHYSAIADGVHSRFSAFFQQDIEDMDREQRDILLILDRNASPEEAREALARRGVTEPNALPILHQLAFGTGEIFIAAEGQRFFEQMLASLLRMLADAPAPHRVLPHLHSFVLSIKGITYYYELIAQHPEILNLLVTLFGTSDSLSQTLIAHPQFFDMLISSHVLYERTTFQEQLGRVEAALRASRKTDRKLVLLRRAAKFEKLLVALRYLLRLRTLAEALAEHSQTADVLVHAALPLAASRVTDRIGTSDGKALSVEQVLAKADDLFAVIALGKYGGNELGFFGDLDVVFVYDDSRATADDAEFFSILSDSLSRVLSDQLEDGRVFELDARLRPHGKNSPLATSLSQYREYLQGEAATWEHQSFLRARHIAGNREILRHLREASRKACSSIPRERLRSDMVEMRARLAANVSTPDRKRHEYKRSEGGITDAEFVLQYLALIGEIDADVAPPSYLLQLDTISQTASASYQAVGMLRRGYSLLRMVESAVRLVTGSSATCLPTEPSHVRSVERLLHIDEGLLDRHLKQILSWNRQAFNEVFEIESASR